MNTLITSDEFDKWLDQLRDWRAKLRIAARLEATEIGNFGHTKSVGDGIFEMKITTGPGYRIYYARKGKTVYWLLNGGDKSTQPKDIQRARKILKRLQEE